MEDEEQNVNDVHAPSLTPQGPPKSDIVISLEDLQTSSVQEKVERLQESAKPQLVRQIGAEPKNVMLRNPVLLHTIYGIVGAVVGALILEVITQPDSSQPHWYGTNSYVATILYFGGVALIIGVAFNVGDSIETRSWTKVFRDIGLGGAIMVGPIVIGCAIANFAWQHLWVSYQESLFLHGGTSAVLAALGSVRLHIVRGLAWGLCAVAMGSGLGAAKRSWRAVGNGAAAGLVGGFIGGFVFDYFRFAIGTVNRVVAFTIIGLLIGLALGLISEITKQHWIEIVSGGMAGKQFIVFSSNTRVGSSPAADITLIKDGSIAPSHFSLQSSGKALTITSNAPGTTSVNGMIAAPRQLLRDGDLIEIGSTVLRYRSKNEAMPSLQ